MPRKRCCGLVEYIPYCRRFFPERDDNPNPAEISLFIEEVEAIRLKDLEGLEQSHCAITMGISRATFQRILQSARAKVAQALVNGQTILIQGGNFIMKNRIFECTDCNHVWEVEPCAEGGKHGYEITCPKCGSLKKSKIENGVKHACGGGRGPGHGCCSGH